MKKIIFLLLLAQTISFITADSGCMKESWGFGEKMPEHTQCFCNCERYVQVLTNRRKCNECGHMRVPKKMEFGKKKKTYEPPQYTHPEASVTMGQEEDSYFVG